LTNADNNVDVIGRVSLSPFARTSLRLLHEASIGASAWYGNHNAGLAFPAQATPGGFVFFNPSWSAGQNVMGSPTLLDLLQDGSTFTLGGEVSLPIGHQVGLRAEVVRKQQNLQEATVPADGMAPTLKGAATLSAIGGYGEAWFWLLGDDRQLPRPGFELPSRLGRVLVPTADPAVMVTARAEVLQENLTSTQTINADPNVATTRVVTLTAGVNYWYGRRVRATVNYALTFFSGTTENIKMTEAAGRSEQELMVLLSMGL
jgi:hypothetical protein